MAATLEERRRAIGDTNADGTLSEAEIFTALENGDRQELLDRVFYEMFGQHLVRYRALQALEGREPGASGYTAEQMNTISEGWMQENVDNLLVRVHQPNDFDAAAVSSLTAITAIEIPHDIARLSVAVLGPDEFQDLPTPPPPPSFAPQPQQPVRSRSGMFEA